MKTLEDLAASKLHPAEQDVVREAADGLFFCENLEEDPATEKLLARLYELVDHLMDGGRLLPETAGRLTSVVEACGPPASVPS